MASHRVSPYSPALPGVMIELRARNLDGAQKGDRWIDRKTDSVPAKQTQGKQRVRWKNHRAGESLGLVMQGPQGQSSAHQNPLSTELGVALEDHQAVTQKPFKLCGMALGPRHGSFQAADFKCSRSLRLGVWCSMAFLVLKSESKSKFSLLRNCHSRS